MCVHLFHRCRLHPRFAHLLLSPVYLQPPHACNCVNCRKGVGVLFVLWLPLPRDTVSISDPKGCLAEYSHNEGVFRGFCSACGSMLYWHNPKYGFEIAVGSIDSEFLLGEDGKALLIPRGGRSIRGEIAGITSPEGLYGGGQDSEASGRRCTWEQGPPTGTRMSMRDKGLVIPGLTDDVWMKESKVVANWC